MKRNFILFSILLIQCHCLINANTETEEITENPNNEKKDSTCGRVDTDLHFNNETQLAPIENKWLALIELRNETEDEFIIQRIDCVAVLISKRNLLAPAQCFLPEHTQSESYYVLVGVWDRNEDVDEWLCGDEEGYCIPPGQELKVVDVAVHPDFDSVTLSNNIAVLTLEEEVEISNYVEPICMLPKALKQQSLIGQFFYLTGFKTDSELKTKTGVKTISRNLCQNINTNSDRIDLFSETHFCGFQQAIPKYEVGSALIGLHIENDEPAYYYLAGYLLYSKTLQGQRTLSRFQDLRPYSRWIEDNIIEL